MIASACAATSTATGSSADCGGDGRIANVTSTITRPGRISAGLIGIDAQLRANRPWLAECAALGCRQTQRARRPLVSGGGARLDSIERAWAAAVLMPTPTLASPLRS